MKTCQTGLLSKSSCSDFSPTLWDSVSYYLSNICEENRYGIRNCSFRWSLRKLMMAVRISCKPPNRIKSNWKNCTGRKILSQGQGVRKSNFSQQFKNGFRNSPSVRRDSIRTRPQSLLFPVIWFILTSFYYINNRAGHTAIPECPKESYL